jgi:hypothetical protein
MTSLMERWALRWAREARSANHPSLFIRADVRPARKFSSRFGVTGDKAKEGSQLQKNSSLAHRCGKSGALGRSTHYRRPLHNPKEQRHHILPFAGKALVIGRDREQGDQEKPMALYISVEEALGMSGLRVVLTPGGPAPLVRSSEGDFARQTAFLHRSAARSTRTQPGPTRMDRADLRSGRDLERRTAAKHLD